MGIKRWNGDKTLNSKFPSLGVVSCHREVWVLHGQKRWACCTVLYCTVLYCTVLYCTVLYCTVLYCTVLYCTVLYCTVLYCTVLYCTVLYCLYNRLQQYYADLFFTVNNIEQYYSSWMGCNNIQIMNVYSCNGKKNIFMRWKMECSIQRGDSRV
jgi:hypothetical protein